MRSKPIYESLHASTQSYRSFDFFISHNYNDRQYIRSLHGYLVNKGYSVYVDWIVDIHLDRSSVTSTTADLLRKRMDESTQLIFATSTTSSSSKWMPWELGYFHGNKGNQLVKILPIVENQYSSFVGQEFLGLYNLARKEDFPGKRLY
ncbi:TIR domain-containing protein [Maridesulfovibrio zosterae]|uniref:TIR domain-containing protein n=1 Tax=Maridesulfovibrio zosterae TaxID=82171 RepID=UPI00146BD81E|nr:TIR domain-containing protein [Maridesulfovibrio zosterae]